MRGGTEYCLTQQKHVHFGLRIVLLFAHTWKWIERKAILGILQYNRPAHCDSGAAGGGTEPGGTEMLPQDLLQMVVLVVLQFRFSERAWCSFD